MITINEKGHYFILLNYSSSESETKKKVRKKTLKCKVMNGKIE